MTNPLRILLVEDNPGDARLLAEILKEARGLSATLKHVDRLEAAKAELRDEKPDLVLLDLSLPDAQGMNTLTGALEAAPDVPVVVLTGLDDEDTAVRAVHAGAQDYLMKGTVEPAMLARAIRYAVERKQIDRERRALLAQEHEARERAEAAVRARDQVLRILSHDLGNQLAAIQVYARLLSSDLPQNEGAARANSWATGIQELAQHLQELRENILDAAQIEAGRLSLIVHSLDVGELLETVAGQLRPLAQDKGIAVEVVCDGVPTTRGDRQRMLQALGNLAGNALKFTQPGGRVTLSAHRTDGGVRLAVADTGAGIAPEDLARIFDSYWKTQAGNPTGVGLGLNIAKGIVEMHGGSISVESELGRGTVFSIALPIERSS